MKEAKDKEIFAISLEATDMGRPLYEKYGLKDRFMEGALEQASYDGKLYAIPVKNISVAGI